MDTFYQNITSLHQASLQLENEACRHCGQVSHLLSHGFVYKKQCRGDPLQVGKRIYCSNRGAKSGCGRTWRLYLCEQTPRLHYQCIHFALFVLCLLAGFSIEAAYQRASNTQQSRNGYRWINKLHGQLAVFRRHLNFREETTALFAHRSDRLVVLLGTCQALFSKFSPLPWHSYQLQLQKPFLG